MDVRVSRDAEYGLFCNPIHRKDLLHMVEDDVLDSDVPHASSRNLYDIRQGCRDGDDAEESFFLLFQDSTDMQDFALQMREGVMGIYNLRGKDWGNLLLIVLLDKAKLLNAKLCC